MQLANLLSVKSMLKKDQIIGDLPTSRNAYQNFFKIAWPSALEAFLVAMIGSVDTIMVGTVGQGAIAAVGITTQPKFIILAMIFSLNVGVTAVTARRKGQNNQKEANRTVRAGIIISAIISCIMAVLGYIFAKPIMQLAGADSSYLIDAISYFRILMLSIPFQALNLTINAAHRGCGKTKISMSTNITSNVVNIIFNYLLINGIGIFPRLEIKGAAIATALGAFVAFCISLSTLFRKNGYLSFHYKADWQIHKEILTPVLKVSSSAFVEQVFLRIGFFAYAAIVARLGPIEYETHVICMNILTLSFCFGDGLSIAASALVGQNLGKERPDLSIIYGKTGQRLSFMVSCVIFFVFIFGRGPLVSMFTKDTAIIALGSNVLILAALGTHMQTSQVVLTGCLRGAGDTSFVAVTSFISVAIVRPILTWLLCFPMGLGLYGAWVALLIDQCIRLITSQIRFSGGKWAKIAL